MREILKEIGLGVAIILLAVLVFRPSAKLLGSSTGYDSLNLTPSASTGDTYGIQVNGTTTVDLAGNVVANVSSTALSTNSLTISGGTAITGRKCFTATWDPPSLTTTTIANASTTNITATGAVLGDLCSGSLTSATTSAVSVGCNITATGVATVNAVNLGTTNAAIDMVSGTATACYTH